MPRRVLFMSIALLATVVAVPIYWIVFMPWLLPALSPWAKLVLALIEVAFDIYLFMRWRSWPALLLLIGSIPVLLVNISMCGWLEDEASRVSYSKHCWCYRGSSRKLNAFHLTNR